MAIELIDTLWNVNKGVYVFDFSDNGELIDTLWNVNGTVGHTLLRGVAIELIDTLWNVNDAGYVSNVLKIRINRYIMECKST